MSVTKAIFKEKQGVEVLHRSLSPSYGLVLADKSSDVNQQLMLQREVSSVGQNVLTLYDDCDTNALRFDWRPTLSPEGSI